MGRWASLVGWVARRDRAASDELPFSYAGGIAAFYWVIIVCVVSELAVVDLLLPWQHVRLASDVLHSAVLFLLLSSYAMLRVNPHLIAPPGLVIRHGRDLELLLPWDRIASVASNHAADPAGIVVHINGTTNVQVNLDRPMTYNSRSVSRICCYVDDPQGFVIAARERTSHPASPPLSAP